MDTYCNYPNNNTFKSIIKNEYNIINSEKTGSDFDRDCVRRLITVLHNGVVPSDEDVNKFFGTTSNTVSYTEFETTFFTLPNPNKELNIKPVFNKQEMSIVPMKVPNDNTIRTNNASLSSQTLRVEKFMHHNIFKKYHERFIQFEADCFTINSQASGGKVTKTRKYSAVQSVENYNDNKGTPNLFVIKFNDGNEDLILKANNESIRTSYIQTFCTNVALYLASHEIRDDGLFKDLIKAGADLKVAYDVPHSLPILGYVAKLHKLDLCIWLIKEHKANPSTLLRWNLVAKDKAITPKEIQEIFTKCKVPLDTISDDNTNYNLLHYYAYFGDYDSIAKMISNISLPTIKGMFSSYNSDGYNAFHIVLTSPEIKSKELRLKLANLLVDHSQIFERAANESPMFVAIQMGAVDLCYNITKTTGQFCSLRDVNSNTVLHLCIKAGLTTLARYIICLDTTIDYNAVDSKGDTCFVLAIKSEDEDLACTILEKSSRAIDIPSKQWSSPYTEHDTCLHQALKMHMCKLANMIIEKSPKSVREPDTKNETPLHLALLNKEYTVVDSILTHPKISELVNLTNRAQEQTPLHFAVKFGLYDYASKFYDNGAKVDVQDADGLTPIHMLVLYALGYYNKDDAPTMTNDQIFALLNKFLSNQPSIDSVTSMEYEGIKNETALHLAIRGGTVTYNLAQSLLKGNGKSNIQNVCDSDHCTPFLRAVQCENFNMVKMLNDARSENMVVDCNKDYALHIAVKNNNYDIVNFLVNNAYKKVYRNFWDVDGYTPLHLAIKKGNAALVRVLCCDSIDSNYRTQEGLTPLMLSVKYPNYECFSILLNKGADLLALDNNRKSIFDYVDESMNPSNNEALKPIVNELKKYQTQLEYPCFTINRDYEDLYKRIQNELDIEINPIKPDGRPIPPSPAIPDIPIHIPQSPKSDTKSDTKPPAVAPQPVAKPEPVKPAVKPVTKPEPVKPAVAPQPVAKPPVVPPQPVITPAAPQPVIPPVVPVQPVAIPPVPVQPAAVPQPVPVQPVPPVIPPVAPVQPAPQPVPQPAPVQPVPPVIPPVVPPQLVAKPEPAKPEPAPVQPAPAQPFDLPQPEGPSLSELYKQRKDKVKKVTELQESVTVLQAKYDNSLKTIEASIQKKINEISKSEQGRNNIESMKERYLKKNPNMTPEMAFQCAFNAFTTQISERISNLYKEQSEQMLNQINAKRNEIAQLEKEIDQIVNTIIPSTVPKTN